MSNYFDIDAINYSKLSLLDKSVRKYYNRYILNIEEPPSPALKLGSAFDCFMTEPENFNNIWKIKNSATTTLNDHITTKELEMITKMSDSVNSFNNWGEFNWDFGDLSLKDIFAMCTKQKEIYWNNKYDFKGKLDYLLELPELSIIIDLKTTRAETLEDCIKSFFNFKYYLQAGMYINGLNHINNTMTRMYFVFVSKITYEVWVIYVSSEVLDYARKEINRLLDKLNNLQINNNWLDGEPCINIKLPSWLNNKY